MLCAPDGFREGCEMSAIGLNVTVVGAGVAGLAVASALARRGARVRVIERAPEIGEVGAGLQVSPNGVRVLDAIGCGGAARERGVASEAVELLDDRGRRVLNMNLPGGTPFLLMHRAALISVLEEAARGAGVEIELGRGLGPGEDPGGDVVIGADGVHSHLRAAINGPEEPFFTGQVAWRALVPCAENAAPRAQVFMAPGRHLVSYPLRAGLRNIVAVEAREGWAAEGWNHEDDPDNLRAAFAGMGGPVPGWLAQVERCHLWGLFRHEVAAKWQDGARRVILGDAAHPTLPFLAQGAVMALEDAWVLGESLGALPVGEALGLYQARRRARVARVIEAANQNARNYHLSGAARLAAHGALRLSGRMAPNAALRRFSWLYDLDVTG